MDSVVERAAVHAALGEPVRLAIVEDLAVSDRSPTELADSVLGAEQSARPPPRRARGSGTDRAVRVGRRPPTPLRPPRARTARPARRGRRTARRSGGVRVQSQLGAFAARGSAVDRPHGQDRDVRGHAPCRSCPSRSGRCGLPRRFGPEPSRAHHVRGRRDTTNSSSRSATRRTKNSIPRRVGGTGRCPIRSRTAAPRPSTQ